MKTFALMVTGAFLLTLCLGTSAAESGKPARAASPAAASTTAKGKVKVGRLATATKPAPAPQSQSRADYYECEGDCTLSCDTGNVVISDVSPDTCCGMVWSTSCPGGSSPSSATWWPGYGAECYASIC